MTRHIRERENRIHFFLMWARLLGFLGLSGCALPPAPMERVELANKARQEELAVLFIGNSYSFGVPAEFKRLAISRGKRVRIGHSTYGGWSLAQHSKHEPTLRKLREHRWDVVVLQDFSLHPAMKRNRRARAMNPAIQFFVSEIRRMGAVPLLYQTWGRRDGNLAIHGDTFLAMNRRVREGYQAASRKAGGVIMVPVGDAWEREVRAGRGHRLFQEDGSHPSAEGNKLTAEVFCQIIFGE